MPDEELEVSARLAQLGQRVAELEAIRARPAAVRPRLRLATPRCRPDPCHRHLGQSNQRHSRMATPAALSHVWGQHWSGVGSFVAAGWHVG